MSLVLPHFPKIGVSHEAAGHSNDFENEGPRFQDEDYVFQNQKTHGLSSLAFDSDRQLSCEYRDESYAPTFDARAIAIQIAI